MAAASTPAKIMGTIGAMQTLVENFPMSILDITNGPTYTSSFMFMADVLKSCGIGVTQILEYLIEKIFGYNVDFDADPYMIYTAIEALPIDEQSDFIQTLETAVKGIIWTVLMGVFSCSAVPILPNTYFDRGKDEEWFHNNYRNKVAIAGDGKGMYISPQMLDYFGYFEVTPFSKPGKIFYNVEGRDIYYIKKKKETEASSEPDEKKVYKVGIQFAPSQKAKLYKTTYKFILDTPIDKTIGIRVDMDTPIDVSIREGETESFIFEINPLTEQVQGIGLTITSEPDDSTTEIELDTDKKLILDKDLSSDVITYWKEVNNDGYKFVDWRSASGPGEPSEDDKYIYERYDGFIPDAVRVHKMIKATEDSADSVVCYQGQDPNTLYQTQDFNAFIWYILNRSANIPQIELNKNMWDNRVYANQFSKDCERVNAEEWNEWYNSKGTEDQEFSFNKDETGTLKPILQLRNENGNIYVQFPSQTYFKPKATDADNAQMLKYRLNASIYRFNWDYLQSIRIFNPKSLLFGYADAMLNGQLAAMAGVNVSLTMKETSARLSNAIKKYIEMEDTEISDCYTSFSNDEFDNMLEDMLLARYGATRYGGEVNRAQVHDVQDLISQLDAVNLASSPEGATTQIMRTLTQIDVSGSTAEGSIEYGVNVNAEGGLFQRVLWAIAMPIIKSIFTPQLILLFLINFNIMGITSLNDTLGTNQGAIIKLIFNKIFTMVRSIIIFIADKIIELLFALFVKVITPLLLKWGWLSALEQIDDWLQLLIAVAMCLPRFKLTKPKATIDEVDYADITDEQTAPENVTNC